MVENNKVPVPLGSGFRLEDWIITAKHVINQVTQKDMLLTTSKSFMVVDKTAWIPVAGNVDMCAMKYTGEITKLGLSKTTAHKIADLNGLPATVSSYGKETSSYLKAGPRSGMAAELVMYTGSTQPGFSGAPYMVHGKAVAMHIGSDVYGIGYNINYLLSIIKQTPQLAGFVRESSDMMEELIAGIDSGDVKYSVRPGTLVLQKGAEFYTFDEELDVYDDMWDAIERRRGRLAKGSKLNPNVSEFVYDPESQVIKILDSECFTREVFDPLESVLKAATKTSAEIASLKKQRDDLATKVEKAQRSYEEVLARLATLETKLPVITSPTSFVDAEPSPKNSESPLVNVGAPESSQGSHVQPQLSTIPSSQSLKLESTAARKINTLAQELIHALQKEASTSTAPMQSTKRNRNRKSKNTMQ